MVLCKLRILIIFSKTYIVLHKGINHHIFCLGGLPLSKVGIGKSAWQVTWVLVESIAIRYVGLEYFITLVHYLYLLFGFHFNLSSILGFYNFLILDIIGITSNNVYGYYWSNISKNIL